MNGHVDLDRVNCVLDREAAGAEAAAVLEHVGECDACAAAFGPLLDVDRLLTTWPVPRERKASPFAWRHVAAAALLVGIAFAFSATRALPTEHPSIDAVNDLFVTRTVRTETSIVRERWTPGATSPPSLESHEVLSSPTPGLRVKRTVRREAGGGS